MKPLSIVLGANQTFPVYTAGNYFRIIDAPGGAVTVECDAPQLLAEVGEGQAIRLKQSFTSLRFTNGATPQTVKVIIGSGEFIDNTFNAEVSGTVTVDSVTNPLTVAGITAPVAIAQPAAPSVVAGMQTTTASLAQLIAIRVGRRRLTLTVGAAGAAEINISTGAGATGAGGSFNLPANSIIHFENFNHGIYIKHTSVAVSVSYIEEY